LIELLADESFFVREAAAWPLSDLGRLDALPQLLAAYQRGLAEGHDNDGFSASLIDLVQSEPVEGARSVVRLCEQQQRRAVARHCALAPHFCSGGA
jgi:hypothetical protein